MVRHHVDSDVDGLSRAGHRLRAARRAPGDGAGRPARSSGGARHGGDPPKARRGWLARSDQRRLSRATVVRAAGPELRWQGPVRLPKCVSQVVTTKTRESRSVVRVAPKGAGHEARSPRDGSLVADEPPASVVAGANAHR